MGVAGSRWTHHHKTKGLFVGAQRYGLPPHPDIARSGQRYTPRTGSHKIPFTVTSVKGGVVNYIRFTDHVRATIDPHRLLATDAEGMGKHFVFHGFIPTNPDYHVHDFGASRNQKIHDPTMARLVGEIDDEGMIEVSLPEIHPKVSFLQHAHLIDDRFLERHGEWLAVRVDLGTFNPGRLRGSFNIVDFADESLAARGEYFMRGGEPNRPDRPPKSNLSAVERGMKFRPLAPAAKSAGGSTIFVHGPADEDGKVPCSNLKRPRSILERKLLDPRHYVYLGRTRKLPAIAKYENLAAA